MSSLLQLASLYARASSTVYIYVVASTPARRGLGSYATSACAPRRCCTSLEIQCQLSLRAIFFSCFFFASLFLFCNSPLQLPIKYGEQKGEVLLMRKKVALLKIPMTSLVISRNVYIPMGRWVYSCLFFACWREKLMEILLIFDERESGVEWSGEFNFNGKTLCVKSWLEVKSTQCEI